MEGDRSKTERKMHRLKLSGAKTGFLIFFRFTFIFKYVTKIVEAQFDVVGGKLETVQVKERGEKPMENSASP